MKSTAFYLDKSSLKVKQLVLLLKKASFFNRSDVIFEGKTSCFTFMTDTVHEVQKPILTPGNP